MSIDCGQLTGLKRDICRGHDDRGQSIKMSPERRVAYLEEWFDENGNLKKALDVKSQARIPIDPRTKLQTKGVGAELKKLIKDQYGIQASASCECNRRAAEMDRRGVEWCEQNQETIAGWLMEDAAERVWLRPVVKLFQTQARHAAERLVKEAIERAKQEDSTDIEAVEWEEPIRKNLIYHVWPVKGYGMWQWNLNRVLASIDQFNGKRIMAIAYDHSTDSPETVQRFVEGHGFEFVITQNDPHLREVKTFVSMLEKIESLDPNEVTFSGHAKGVRHKQIDEGSTVSLWTEALYRTVYENWEGAKDVLKTKAMAGSFKRYGQFRTQGNHRWHYSGTFYWFRNRDVFQRNWRKVDQMFFGTESWPGLLFKKEEAGCLFLDNAADLYNLDYWNRVVKPELEKWNGSVPA